ncbi:MAG: hypothetical protein ACK4HE_10750 [Chitinophagaceae bacterium]|jgi:hypothetical protein
MANTFSIIVPCKAGEVLSLSNSIMYYLQHYTTALKELTILRCKHVLVELFTNAIKHAGCATVHFTVNVNADAIIIQKVDTGLRLQLKQFNIRWDESVIGIKQHLYNALYVEVISTNELYFHILPPPTPDAIVSGTFVMHEHFGLQIIASACSSFRYYYNTTTRENIYTATIPLNDL